MFASLAAFVSRAWLFLLIGWIALVVVVRFLSPDWNEVAQDGQFSFLPQDYPSRRADELFDKAFPRDLLASSIVVVASREDEKLRQEDIQFISDELKPELQTIADESEVPAPRKRIRFRKAPAVHSEPRPLVASVHSVDDKGIGTLMMSADGKAALVVLELTTDFFSHLNRPTIQRIEDLLDRLRQSGSLPCRVELSLTGSAVVGRDITRATEQSAAATQAWTIALVVGLTLLIFRAPLLALIPLVTLYCAMDVALKLLAILAGAGWIEVFRGIEAYSTVVVYASGIDFGLFMISRFREELDRGAGLEAGLRHAVTRVGAAISASAATEIVGIGMLAWAEFGKFRQAGIAISFSLFIMLLSVLTLTPALLHLCGRKAFWPKEPAPAEGPKLTLGESRIQALWEGIARSIARRPGTYWLTTVLAMLPFALIGVLWYNHLNYDLVANLPRHASSARGTAVLQRHFPAGATGPVNMLLENDKIDFRSSDGFEAIQTLTERLNDNRQELKIADIRSESAPLGTTGAGKLVSHGPLGRRLVTAAAVRRRATDFFVSPNPEFGSHVTKLALELTLDPFSEEAMDFLGHLEAEIRKLLPEELQGSQILFNGSTASLRDLKVVGARDRTRINILVVLSVFVILVILLRRTMLTVYLLLTVLFSYLVTLGVTFGVFYLADPAGFPGLDWTVPLFLFTVLIAIGEDYNILLVTRVHEEEEQLGPIAGVATALTKTGPIISSCGLIMSGTFLSLLIAGQLSQMIQLGFALAFGVLLDTFVVRPILVPSYLLLLHSGYFGPLGKYLGGKSVRRSPRGTSVLPG
jgi:RND superfamily putative drug exporter